MPKYGMVINTKKCIGCYACRVACQQQNKLEPGEWFIRYERQETGEYPEVKRETVPMQCMHCDDAPCQRVCPTGATYTTPEGVVLVEKSRCIGCLYCMAACPYQVRVQNPKTHEVHKCRFCAVLEAQGKEPSSCVHVCPTGARVFGDISDPNSEISKVIAQDGAKPLKGDLTRANLFYVR